MQRRWALGECWLWCERTAVPVLWLGPALWDGGRAVEPGAHPTRHSGHQPARDQSRNTKRAADSVGSPSRKIEAAVYDATGRHWSFALVHTRVGEVPEAD
ncbi:hypothetical protein Shyhy02_61220 [Streptomyces hygroscopicus subsp. hygroscopicus]|nr:hypothetical protein Shyhy02_61220 [Streptomyces hygroscopicus subsp. hygroscopicus]